MKIAAYSFIGFVIYTIFSTTFQWYNPIVGVVNSIPFGDKIAHLVLIGGVTFFFNYLLRFRKINLFQQNLLLGTLLMFVFVTVEEFSQYWIPTRSFDLLDLTFNYLGIIFATLFILINKKSDA